MTPQRIAEAARAYLGVPFHPHGRTRAGLDCAGLVLAVARDLGLVLRDVPPFYAPLRSGFALLRELRDQLVEVNFRRPPAGAVLAFSFGRAEHAAILIEAPACVVHAWRSAGRVVETVLDDATARRVVGAFLLEQVGHG